MKQSELMSLVAAVTNVAVGHGVAVLAQLIVLPWFGLPARRSDALAIGAMVTALWTTRRDALRRLFEAIRVRRATPRHAKGTSRLAAAELKQRFDRAFTVTTMRHRMREWLTHPLLAGLRDAAIASALLLAMMNVTGALVT